MTLLLALFEGARPPDQCEGTRSSCRCVWGGARTIRSNQLKRERHSEQLQHFLGF